MTAKTFQSSIDDVSDTSIRVISFKFLSLLIPSVALCAIFFAGVYAFLKESYVEKELLEKLELVYSVHSQSISTPLWTLDYSGLDSAMRTMAIYPEITCVEVEDTGEDTQFYWPENCGLEKNLDTEFKRQIYYNDKPIGWIYVSYTEAPALAVLYREILLGAIFFFLLVVVISIVVFITLRLIFGRPLMLLMQSIRAAEKADIRNTVNWASTDEIGEVIDAYNSLIVQVNEKTSELVKARDQAEKATESKGHFLTNMSHELRTPLNSVIGITEMLREEAEDEQRDTEAFDRVAGSGRHLLHLIDNILQYTKIDANKLELSNSEFNVAVLVEEIIPIVRPLAEQKNNVLEVVSNCEDEIMTTDEYRIKQILINLLENACKFTENGKIVFEVQASKIGDRAYFTFSVRDTGIGISTHNESRIFEEFVQADESTTRQYGGTGLGLAISQRLCTLLGGKIGVRSELGHGSEFFFTLPAKPS